MSNALLLIARILLAAIFVEAGFSKLLAAEGVAGYFGSLGLPSSIAFAYLVGAFELIAGLLVLVGLGTRPAAYALALFAIGSAFVGHFGHGGEDATLVMMNHQAFMKNLAVAGGYLVLAVFGPGALSLDARRGAGAAGARSFA